MRAHVTDGATRRSFCLAVEMDPSERGGHGMMPEALAQGVLQDGRRIVRGLLTAPCDEAIRPQERCSRARDSVGLWKAAFGVVAILSDAVSLELQSAEAFARCPDSIHPRAALSAGQQQEVSSQIDRGKALACAREPDVRRPRAGNSAGRPWIGVNADRGVVQVAELDV